MAASLLATAAVANAQLAIDSFADIGSATLGGSGGWGGYTSGAGYTSMLARWEVTFGNVDIVPSSFPSPQAVSAVSSSVDQSGFTVGGMRQTFTTSIGHLYTHGFDYTGNSAGSAVAGMNTVNPVPLGFDIVSASSGSPIQWLTHTDAFAALTTTTPLSRSSITSGSGGVLLDNASVTAVPETRSIALLLAALGVVGFLARRRGVIGGQPQPMAA